MIDLVMLSLLGMAFAGATGYVLACADLITPSIKGESDRSA